MQCGYCSGCGFGTQGGEGMSTVAQVLKERPVIASVKDEAGLGKALGSPCQTLFILYGDITNIESIVQRAKRDGRTVMAISTWWMDTPRGRWR